MHKRPVLLILFLLVLAVPIFANTAVEHAKKVSERPAFIPGEIIVKFRENVDIEVSGITDKSSLNQLNDRFGVKEIENIFNKSGKDAANLITGMVAQKSGSKSRTYKIKIEDDDDSFEALREYSKDPNVEYAEPNYLYYVDAEANDPSYDVKWGLTNIKANSSWDITTGNQDIVIAIIDTGVDYDHEDLEANMQGNCTGGCPNSTGYDVVEINTTAYQDAGFELIPEEDYTVNDNDPDDYNGHGSHCAGIAAAVSNNSIGTTGTCWNCRIMPVRAGFSIRYDGGTYGLLENDDISEAIIYAADSGADIISMSFGGSYSSTIEDAIEYASNKSIILIAAAGNDGVNNTSYPAGYDKVLSVAAHRSNDRPASFTNYGSWVDVSAPGNSIYSTVSNNGYGYKSGTSMAAPMVAGAAGILLSYNSSLNQTEITELFQKTGENITDYKQTGLNITKIDLFDALLDIYTGPSISITRPETDNIASEDYMFIEASSTDEVSNVALVLENTTVQMGGSSTYFFYNLTGSGFYTFHATARDSYGLQIQSGSRTVFLNNSAPSITGIVPDSPVSINEPENQTFSINYTDDGPYTSILWYYDGSLFENGTEADFIGSYSSQGTHNVSVVVNDSVLYDYYSWILNVNDSKGDETPPVISISEVENIASEEHVFLNITANENVKNTTLHLINRSQEIAVAGGGTVWHHNLTGSGWDTFYVSAYDLNNNPGNSSTYTIFLNNSAPNITNTSPSNTKINIFENENQTFEFYYDDDGPYSYIRWFFEGANIANDTEQWKYYGDNNTNVSYNISVIINDSALYDYHSWQLSIYRRNTSVLGDTTSIESSSIPEFDISINGSGNTGQQFEGLNIVNITNSSQAIVEFKFDFTNSSLDLSGLKIEKQLPGRDYGGIIIKGLNHTGQEINKTVYVDRINSSLSSICIKDAEINGFGQISARCNGENETYILCPNSSGKYNCTVKSNRFIITGLSHSGVRQQTYCGDGNQDPGEDCDGSDMGNETCQTLGFDRGTLECEDDCSYDNTSCWWTADDDSQDNNNGNGGGGGGGGGGGSDYETASAYVSSGPKYSRYYGIIDAGNFEIPISNSEIAVKNLKIKFAKKNENVDFKIQKLDDISHLDQPPSDAYQYLAISMEGLINNSITSVAFRFRIPKFWFGEVYDKDQVYLERYHDGRWLVEQAHLLSDENGSYHYLGGAKEFSFFAITAEKLTPDRDRGGQVLSSGTENNQPSNKVQVEELKEPEIQEPKEMNNNTEKKKDKGPSKVGIFFSRIKNFFIKNLVIIFVAFIFISLLLVSGLNMYYMYRRFILEDTDAEPLINKEKLIIAWEWLKEKGRIIKHYFWKIVFKLHLMKKE